MKIITVMILISITLCLKYSLHLRKNFYLLFSQHSVFFPTAVRSSFILEYFFLLLFFHRAGSFRFSVLQKFIEIFFKLRIPFYFFFSVAIRLLLWYNSIGVLEKKKNRVKAWIQLAILKDKQLYSPMYFLFLNIL